MHLLNENMNRVLSISCVTKTRGESGLHRSRGLLSSADFAVDYGRIKQTWAIIPNRGPKKLRVVDVRKV